MYYILFNLHLINVFSLFEKAMLIKFRVEYIFVCTCLMTCKPILVGGNICIDCIKKYICHFKHIYVLFNDIRSR